MKRFMLQPYGDGHIYKNLDGSYTVIVGEKSGSGMTIQEALENISKTTKIEVTDQSEAVEVKVKATKKTSTKKSKK